MGSPGSTLLVWVGCGAIAMCGSLCYTELGTMYPNASGGEYVYIQKAFGDLPAFLLSFTSVLIIKPSSMAIIALTCGDYVIEAVTTGKGADPGYAKLIAFFLLGKCVICCKLRQLEFLVILKRWHIQLSYLTNQTKGNYLNIKWCARLVEIDLDVSRV